MSKPRRATLLFIGCSALACLALGLWLRSHLLLKESDLTLLLVCVAIAVFMERLSLMQSQASGWSIISPTHAAVFGALWLLGPIGALFCTWAAVLANAVFRRTFQWDRLLANVVSVTLATLAASRVGVALGLGPGHTLTLFSLLALTASLLAYFAANSLTVAALIAINTGSRLVATWREHFLWLAPQYVAMGLVGAVGAAAYLAMGAPGLFGYAVPLVAVYYSLRLYLQKADLDLHEMRTLNSRLEDTNEQLIEALASIVDARDALLYGHSTQVAMYAMAIGAELGLAGGELDRVRKAALLHDVGKVAVPEQILFKPGPLTSEEYSMIQHHAIVGERLVGLVDALRPLSVLVGQHHEAWDGRGYPRRLEHEEIDLGARIINLCDSLDTILSDRPYKAGRPLEWAVAEVKRCSGTQFDPKVVEAFLRVLEQHGPSLFGNSAYATAIGPRRTELFAELRRLGLNVRDQFDIASASNS